MTAVPTPTAETVQWTEQRRAEAEARTKASDTRSSGSSTTTFVPAADEISYGTAIAALSAASCDIILRIALSLAQMQPPACAHHAGDHRAERPRCWARRRPLLPGGWSPGWTCPGTRPRMAAISAPQMPAEREHALQLLTDLRDHQRPRSMSSYSSAIAACAWTGSGRPRVGCCVGCARNVVPNEYSYGGAIAPARRGARVRAVVLLDEPARPVPRRRPLPPAISACAKGAWQRALRLLLRMLHVGVVPNDRSYNAAISACARWGMARRLALLQRMRSAATAADAAAASAAVNVQRQGERRPWPRPR